MTEPVVLHVCPCCGRVFNAPAVCAESGEDTMATPMIVSDGMFQRLAILDESGS